MWLILTFILSILQLTFMWPQYHYQQQKPQQNKERQNQPNINNPLTAVSTAGFAGSTYRDYYKESNYKCYDRDSGRHMLVGDFFTRFGQCIRVQCLGTLKIWEDRCQVPKVISLNGDGDNGNCSSLPVANEFLDYPRCCPLYECYSYRINRNSEIETRQTYDHKGNLIREHITQRILIILDRRTLMDKNESMVARNGITGDGRIQESTFLLSKSYE